MKLKDLIKKLQSLENEFKDSEVVVDFEKYNDADAYYNLEAVSLVRGEDDRPLINLKSSNEQ